MACYTCGLTFRGGNTGGQGKGIRLCGSLELFTSSKTMTRRGRHVQRGLESSSIANSLPPPESQLHTHTHTPPSHRIIAQAGCCLASCHATVLFSHCAALSSSRRPLTAPPNCRLIVPPGCCVSSRHTVILSSRHPLTAPPSCHLIAQAGCCVTSRHAAISSSHHTAPSSSCRPLTVLPSCHLIVP